MSAQPSFNFAVAVQGALEYLGGGLGMMKLKIVKPIKRFPAGLNGSHAVVFVLAKGVPMPAGSPGHSCVISEETGAAAGNVSPLCRL